MQDITIDLRTQGFINPKDLPYIDWKRVVNPGQSDQREEVQRVVLFDQKGSPFVWVDEAYVSYNLKKGWKIAGHGNFDKVKRHDGTPHQALEDIRGLVEGNAQSFQVNEYLRAENEKLKAERAQLIAERNAMPAASVAGDFRTQDERDAGLSSIVLDKEIPGGHTALETTNATTHGTPGNPSSASAPGTTPFSAENASASVPASSDVGSAAAPGSGKSKNAR